MNQQRRNAWAAGAALVSAILLNLTLSGTAQAATITQTGFYPDIFGDGSYTSPGAIPTGFTFAEELVTGVDKFDPALGTLTSVTLFAEFDSDFALDVSAADVIDDSMPHSVDVDADFLSAFIGYAPSGGGTTIPLISTDYFPSASCFGDPFSGPCSDIFGDFELGIGSSVVSGLGSYDLTDFVGIGPVTSLSAIIAVPGDALFALDNVSFATAELTAGMLYIDLTVEYEFTPIPEPSTALLALVGVAAFIRRRIR